MQVDMHYYATDALARAGGFTREHSRIIATASQFVDDNAGTWDDEEILFNDGARLDVEPTAHHVLNWTNWTGWMRKHGLAAHQQRRVRVPFHFLPGGEGETCLTRMVCRKDSEIAREMVEHHLAKNDKSYCLPLPGIMAHVYADTFSRYGFSGVAGTSRRRSCATLPRKRRSTSPSTSSTRPPRCIGSTCCGTCCRSTGSWEIERELDEEPRASGRGIIPSGPVGNTSSVRDDSRGRSRRRWSG